MSLFISLNSMMLIMRYSSGVSRRLFSSSSSKYRRTSRISSSCASVKSDALVVSEIGVGSTVTSVESSEVEQPNKVAADSIIVIQIAEVFVEYRIGKAKHTGVLLQSWAESSEDSVSHSLMAAACGRC